MLAETHKKGTNKREIGSNRSCMRNFVVHYHGLVPTMASPSIRSIIDACNAMEKDYKVEIEPKTENDRFS